MSFEYIEKYRPQNCQPLSPDGYIPSSFFMDVAITLGEQCPPRGQHPVGAVVTMRTLIWDTDTGGLGNYEIVVGVGENQTDQNSTKHAEVVAIESAERNIGRRALGNSLSVLYTTHEPCPMCAGAIANSKLGGVVFGTKADDALRLSREKGVKWRSNHVSGLEIIRGRKEAGRKDQFVIGGFEKEKCIALLARSAEIVESPPVPKPMDIIFMPGIEPLHFD